jgi:DNA-binding NarL/FixJ family response regulator
MHGFLVVGVTCLYTFTFICYLVIYIVIGMTLSKFFIFHRAPLATPIGGCQQYVLPEHKVTFTRLLALQRIRAWCGGWFTHSRASHRKLDTSAEQGTCEEKSLSDDTPPIRVVLLETIAQSELSLKNDLISFHDICLLQASRTYDEVFAQLDRDTVDLVVIDAIRREHVRKAFFDIRNIRWTSPNTHVIAIQGGELPISERATLVASGVMACFNTRPNRKMLHHAIHRTVRERTVIDSTLARFIHQRFLAEDEQSHYLTNEEKTLLQHISAGTLSSDAIADETNTRHLGNVLLKFASRFGPQIEQNLKRGSTAFADGNGDNMTYESHGVHMPRVALMRALALAMFTHINRRLCAFRAGTRSMVCWLLDSLASNSDVAPDLSRMQMRDERK